MANRLRAWTALAGVMLLASALSGCATYNTAQNIRPWGDEAQGMDLVDEVTAAWREADGDIRICVTGSAAERSDNMAMLFPGKPYSILFPARLYETGAPDAPKLHRTMDPVPEFNLTAVHVEGPCSAAPANAVALPVRRVQPADLGADSFTFADNKIRDKLFMATPAGPAVFEFVDTPSSALYYRAAARVFDGSAVVEIDLDLRKVEPRPAWVLALPFALVFDVATSPVQLAICLFSVGCAS